MVSLSVLLVPPTGPEDFDDRVKLRVVTLQCWARKSERAFETFKQLKDNWAGSQTSQLGIHSCTSAVCQANISLHEKWESFSQLPGKTDDKRFLLLGWDLLPFHSVPLCNRATEAWYCSLSYGSLLLCLDPFLWSISFVLTVYCLGHSLCATQQQICIIIAFLLTSADPSDSATLPLHWALNFSGSSN